MPYEILRFPTPGTQCRHEAAGTRHPGQHASLWPFAPWQSAGCALSRKIKEIKALAIAVTVRCDGCIAFHLHDAIAAGADRDEITEAIGVAVLMGGGPSVVYGCEALKALGQL
nr:carboxymuconolactone decarboxylase family protein [Neolewinella litorea]